MKRLLILLFAFVLLSACSTKAIPVERISESNALVTEENDSDTSDSQQGIPAEYRLRRNIEIGWDEPIPLPEGEEFREIIQLLGMDGTKPEIPAVSDLFTAEEIENHFGLKVAEVEEENQFEAVFKKVTFYFEEGDAGTSPSVSITVSTLRKDEDPDAFLYLIPTAERLAEKIGVEATIHEYFGINITILTEKDEIITIQAIDMKQQKDLVIDFAKLVHQRLSESR